MHKLNELRVGLTPQRGLALFGLAHPPANLAITWTDETHDRRLATMLELLQQARDRPMHDVGHATAAFIAALPASHWPVARDDGPLLNRLEPLRTPMDVAIWWGLDAVHADARCTLHDRVERSGSMAECNSSMRAARSARYLRDMIGAAIGGFMYARGDHGPISAASLRRAWQAFEKDFAGYRPFFMIGVCDLPRITMVDDGAGGGLRLISSRETREGAAA